MILSAITPSTFVSYRKKVPSASSSERGHMNPESRMSDRARRVNVPTVHTEIMFDP